jgi:hypothetical protein
LAGNTMLYRVQNREDNYYPLQMIIVLMHLVEC